MSAQTRAIILRTIGDVIEGARSRQLQEAFEKGRIAGARETLECVAALAREDKLIDFADDLLSLLRASD